MFVYSRIFRYHHFPSSNNHRSIFSAHCTSILYIKYTYIVCSISHKPEQGPIKYSKTNYEQNFAVYIYGIFIAREKQRNTSKTRRWWMKCAFPESASKATSYTNAIAIFLLCLLLFFAVFSRVSAYLIFHCDSVCFTYLVTIINTQLLFFFYFLLFVRSMCMNKWIPDVHTDVCIKWYSFYFI